VAVRGIAERGPDRLKRLTPEEKTQRQFESLAEQQAALGLEDWRGLTWTSPSTRAEIKTDEQGNDHKEYRNYGLSRINRDFLVMKKHKLSGETYVERMFDVVTRNERGVITGRSLYSVSRLWELFNSHEKRDRDLRKDNPAARVPLGLYWEVGIDPKEATERGPEPHMTFEDALALLLGKTEDEGFMVGESGIRPDIYERLDRETKMKVGRAALSRTVGSVKHAKVNKTMRFKPNRKEEPYEAAARKRRLDTELSEAGYAERIQEQAGELMKVVKEIGSDRLYEVVSEIQDVYEQDKDILGRLGIEGEDLPDEYILMMQESSILSKLMERRLQGDVKLFDDTPQAKARRIRDAEDELGKVFIGGALKSMQRQIPDPESGNPKATKTLVKRTENQDVLGRIRHFIFRQKIEELLEKELENEEQTSALTPDEHAEVGQMLRRSMGRIP
jgi:hypothetical protein